MVWANVSKLNRNRTEQSFNRTELGQNRSTYKVWVDVLKLNRDKTEQSYNRTVRTEQVELHDLGRRFETEQR